MILKFKTGFSHLAQENLLVVLLFYDPTSYVYIPIYVPNLHLVWSIYIFLKNINKFVILRPYALHNQISFSKN